MNYVYGRIYLLTCLANGKKYVGQTVRSLHVRWVTHFNGAKHPGKKKFYLHRALLKHGKEGFQISLVCSCYSKEELDLMEDLYIAAYDTMNPDKGYNSRRGGGNGKFSAESRKRCSESKRGLKYQPRKIAGPRGIDHPNFGRKATLEARRKMSENRSGEKHYKFRKDVSTEDLIHLYETHTAVEIAKMLDIDPSTVGDRLRKAGITLTTSKGKQGRQRRRDVDTQELVRLYREGLNTKELSKMFSMTPASIANRIKSTGEKMRPRFYRSPTG